ncbi:hypothetical protein B0T25DRAFT_294846 [Lasiosphaeria hispida]|uniref:Uncharacterized protein n=1 Tax=Lasiosphaeria hispida TaxID=260671 RepID=A0AAJ0MBG0_9PEZI|nr:hypothetical protein B0T25DRAFT_294846 [Lasiosphaeria hispida]
MLCSLSATRLLRSFPLPLQSPHSALSFSLLHLVPIPVIVVASRIPRSSRFRPSPRPKHMPTMNRPSADWSCATVNETPTLPGSPKVESSRQSEPQTVEAKGGDEEEAGMQSEGSRCWTFWGSDGPSIFKLLMVFSALAMVLSILFQVIQFFLQYFKHM